MNRLSAPPDVTSLVQVAALKPGDLIYADNSQTPYRVEYVNVSRAYCVPLSGKKKVIKKTAEDGQSVETHVFESLGDGINISPNAYVERLTEADLDEAQQKRFKKPLTQPPPNEQEHTVAVASIPVADKSNRAANKDRRARMEARKRADRAAGLPGTGRKAGTGRLAAAKSKTAKAPKTVRKCACGCGEETMSYFAPGHDARYHGWLKKLASGVLEPSDLTAAQRKAIGDLKKSGKGYAPVLDYKGEKYHASH